MVEQDRPGKIFVGGLSTDVDEKILENAFSKYGRLTEILVIRDKINAKSRGYGFVTFENPLDAEDAVKGMEGTELNGKPIHTEQAVRSVAMDRGMRGRGGRRGSSRGGYLDRPRRMSGSRRSPPPRRGGFSARGGRGGPPSSFHGGRSLMGNGRRDYSPPRKGPLITDPPRASFSGPPRRDFDGPPPRRLPRGDRRDDRNGYRDRSYSPRGRDLYPPSPPLRDTPRSLIDGRGPPPRSRDYGSHDFRDQNRDYAFSRDYSPEPVRSRDYGLVREDRVRDAFSRAAPDYIAPRGDLGSRDLARDYASSRDYGPPSRDYVREREPLTREYSSRDIGGGGRYTARSDLDSRGPPRDYPSRGYEDTGPSRRSIGGPGSRGPPSQPRGPLPRGPPTRGPPSLSSSRGRGGAMGERRLDRPSFSGSSSRRPGPPPSRGPPPMKRSRMDGPPPSRR